MSYWFSNKLTISGEKSNLRAFKDQARDIETDLCLNNVVPMPKEYWNAHSSSLRDEDIIYKWRVSNWGVNDIGKVLLIHESENLLIYEFGSRWRTPDIWMKKVGNIFPELCFELYYKLPEMNFQGTILVQKDLFIIQEDEYSDDEENFKKELVETTEIVREEDCIEIMSISGKV